MDRCFEAFEAGTLQAELCNEKVPAVDRGMLEAIVENFERVMAEGPAPQKKHPLHRLVKKVLVQDRRTVEVWYGLPNFPRFEGWNKWLPGPDSNQRQGG